MEQYIRITKAANEFLWYKDYIGTIYPIAEPPESNVEYRDQRFLLEGCYGLSILKSDCELVSITVNMPEEKEKARKIAASNIEEAAKKYGESRNHMPQFIEEDAEAFQAGAEWALQQSTIKGENALLAAGDISGEWLEKAKKEGYTISERQVEELAKTAGSDNLTKEERFAFVKALFPNAEVFQPKITYKVGDRFKWDEYPDTKYEIVELKNNLVVILVDDESLLYNEVHGVTPIKVADTKAITEAEMEQITGPFALHEGCFTLIEPSNP